MMTIMISTHGHFGSYGQLLVFSDGEMIPLYELIRPIQQKMDNRPILVFVQCCRGKFNEAYADEMCRSDAHKLVHIMRDTYFIYSSPAGNRAWRPKTSTQPSFFIDILAKNLKSFGQMEDLESVSRRTIN